MACAPELLRCTPCLPGETTCGENGSVLLCAADGERRSPRETCDADRGYACRRGGCVQLCDEATRNRSNVGCEYWPVDLDNAVLPDGNAAVQQFAVIVSNPQPDLPAKVTIEEDKVRVSGPKIDTLQEVIAFLKEQDYGRPLQFVNYR